ncbi:TIGR04442 family protein [Geobacter hydrogenophilus]|uniref:TIGR04442 family protein n=1 Tax=Geobacter hydrogenophilus TaxID=40983 RepID=A0A9W6G4E4_9BACT|nr:TIGR04442 family protein [Geobacter hydrogenophilus]MBT0892728.1 TIGR04442 family protein [Geobacter hydrogenophilus]GLI40127.1 TIGR04442 family protein [Geobacter hydrogenophilus]
MNKDIRLHGHIDDRIEYYAIVAGEDAHRRYFFNAAESNGAQLRFFSPGNEFVIGRGGIRHAGNGGSFCEYMFGVDQPMTDLAKGDVINRLVVYGARSGDEGGTLHFSEQTGGELGFDKIFFDGNAVANYFFFLASERLGTSLRQQQTAMVRAVGKALKRSPAVGAHDENTLIDEVLGLLNDPGALFFLFKLVNIHHREYYDTFRSLYFASKKISDEDFAGLSAIAERHNIDRYQQERIRIDVMYKHPANRRIVDEYKNILIGCHLKGEISALENARLTRLKTLSVRNKIPGALFYALDDMLKKDKKIGGTEEHESIAETRQILEGLFLRERDIESAIDREDMVRLLFAKKRAAEVRDHTFEEILLDASKGCDERIRDGGNLSLLEGFSHIITYFDRFDATSQAVNQLAFMETVRISEEMIRSLLGNRSAFEELRPGLFTEIFIDGILENKYLGRYGRRKVTALVAGLRLIEENRLTVAALLDELLAIDREERLAIALLNHVRDRIRNFYSNYATRDDQATMKREVTEDLRKRKIITDTIPARLFDETIVTIKKEAVYLHSLLPQIIGKKDSVLREDFLENSGLDRFYVEELEREYFELNRLDLEQLYQIRKGLS